MMLRPISVDQFLNPKLSAWLHILRWLAAFAVLLAHAHDRIILPLEQIAAHDRNIPVYLWSFASGFGHIAVVIFFVLSGYLVGGAALIELLNTGNIRLRRYFTNRLTRLYVVLIPALLVTALLDRVGQQVYSAHLPYVWAAQHSINGETLACNLGFLQTVTCYAFGTNRPLWSLANEFWYYIIWPLILSPFMYKRSLIQRVLLFVVGVTIVGMLVFLQKTFASYLIVPYMLIWIIGVVPILVHKPVLKSPNIALAVLFVFTVAIRIAVKGFMWEEFRIAFLLDVPIAFVLCCTLTSLVHGDLPLKNIERWRFHKGFADFSYSLYVVHMPVVTIASVWLLSRAGVSAPATPGGTVFWLIVVLVVVGTFLVAYLFSLVTERQTPRVRQWCNQIVAPK